MNSERTVTLLEKVKFDYVRELLFHSEALKKNIDRILILMQEDIEEITLYDLDVIQSYARMSGTIISNMDTINWKAGGNIQGIISTIDTLIKEKSEGSLPKDNSEVSWEDSV